MRGFSLLELLITLTLIGLIAGFTLPTYRSYFEKTDRLEAIHALLQYALQLEKYHLIHHTYENATFKKLNVSEFTRNNRYQLHLLKATHETFTISASPLFDEAICGTLNMDKKYRQSISGTGTIDDCWEGYG